MDPQSTAPPTPAAPIVPPVTPPVPVTTPPPPSMPPVSTHSSFKWVWIGLGILLLLGLATGGVFVGKQVLTPAPTPTLVPLPPTDTPIPPTPSPTPDPTLNWEMYLNSSKTITFKYPPSLFPKETTPDFISLVNAPNQAASNAEISVDTRHQGNYKDYPVAVVSTKVGLTDIQETELTNGTRITGKIKSGVGEGQILTMALLKYAGGAVVFETTSTDSAKLITFDQIVSTFKIVGL